MAKWHDQPGTGAPAPNPRTLTYGAARPSASTEGADTQIDSRPEEHEAVAPTLMAPTGTGASLHGAAMDAALNGVGTGNTARSTVLPRVASGEEGPALVVEAAERFHSLRIIGEGGGGLVVAAQDNDIDRVVAIKKLHGSQHSPEMLIRFVEEIRTTGRLEHPNVVPIHDVGVDAQGAYYFVMKYVDGETLASIIDHLIAGEADYHRRYGFEARVQIIQAVLEALAFSHSKGILHRDIKPANIMVGRFGEVLLMDWGIARPIDSEGPATSPTLSGSEQAPEAGASGRPSRGVQTRHGALVGTPAYMSPEQARGEPLDARSDIYSLCVTMYELLTLQHPLPEHRDLHDLLKAVQEAVPPLAGFVRNPHQPPVPMDLTWLLRKGLRKERERRFQSAQEMIDRLKARAEGKIPIECHITFGKRVTNEVVHFVERHPMAATLTPVLLVASMAAILLFGR